MAERARDPIAGRGSHAPLTDAELGERLYRVEQENRALAAALSAAQDALRELKQHDADSTDPKQKLPSWAIRFVDRTLDA